jgi:hypothetical protein
MSAPLLQVRLITSTERADTIAATFLDAARTVLGPTATYHTRKLPARRHGHCRVYLTVTPIPEGRKPIDGPCNR